MLGREMCVPRLFSCLWKEEKRHDTEFQPWTATLCCSTWSRVILGLSLMAFWAVHITQIMLAWSSMTSKIWIIKSEIARKSSSPCRPSTLSSLQLQATVIVSSALFHRWFADGLTAVWGVILHHKTNMEEFLCKFVKHKKKTNNKQTKKPNKYFLWQRHLVQSNPCTTQQLPCKPLHHCCLQEEWQKHQRAKSVFNSRFLLHPEATQTTGSPQVPVYVFLRSWQPLIIHRPNRVWVSRRAMSPSAAPRRATPSPALQGLILSCSAPVMSCQTQFPASSLSELCLMSDIKQRPWRLSLRLRGRGWHLWVCIKQRELIHQLLF